MEPPHGILSDKKFVPLTAVGGLAGGGGVLVRDGWERGWGLLVVT